MADEKVLRDKARAAIEIGRIPYVAPDRTCGGPGVGTECSVCGLPVTKSQIEFEIQFARKGNAPDLGRFHVHIRCFAAWELERHGCGLPSA